MYPAINGCNLFIAWGIQRVNKLTALAPLAIASLTASIYAMNHDTYPKLELNDEGLADALKLVPQDILRPKQYINYALILFNQQLDPARQAYNEHVQSSEQKDTLPMSFYDFLKNYPSNDTPPLKLVTINPKTESKQ
jgi:hypothetical protein